MARLAVEKQHLHVGRPGDLSRLPHDSVKDLGDAQVRHDGAAGPEQGAQFLGSSQGLSVEPRVLDGESPLGRQPGKQRDLFRGEFPGGIRHHAQDPDGPLPGHHGDPEKRPEACLAPHRAATVPRVRPDIRDGEGRAVLGHPLGEPTVASGHIQAVQALGGKPRRGRDAQAPLRVHQGDRDDPDVQVATGLFGEHLQDRLRIQGPTHGAGCLHQEPQVGHPAGLGGFGCPTQREILLAQLLGQAEIFETLGRLASRHRHQGQLLLSDHLRRQGGPHHQQAHGPAGGHQGHQDQMPVQVLCRHHGGPAGLQRPLDHACADLQLEFLMRGPRSARRAHEAEGLEHHVPARLQGQQQHLTGKDAPRLLEEQVGHLVGAVATLQPFREGRQTADPVDEALDGPIRLFQGTQPAAGALELAQELGRNRWRLVRRHA